MPTQQGGSTNTIIDKRRNKRFRELEQNQDGIILESLRPLFLLHFVQSVLRIVQCLPTFYCEVGHHIGQSARGISEGIGD